mmetsp:Transcript_62321/g.166628  ORF Transcript_62321/g.166628 Transcript_62321/m.166628 type:complete len:318 (-) Transcript_62321:54-1007(-)
MMAPPAQPAAAAVLAGEFYGSLTDSDFVPAGAKKPLSTGRRHVDRITMAMSLVVPWLAFVIACAVLTYRNRLAGLWLALLFLLVLRLAYIAYDCWRGRHRRGGVGASLISMFFLTTVLAAIIVGIVVGKQNSAMLQPYDVMSNMGIYFDVNPGAPEEHFQVEDAGRVFFVPGTHLDVSKSEGFKSGSVYCVAPVTSTALKPGDTVDFWAVGVDCCSGTAPDFTCGDYANPKVYAGMQLMDNGQRPYFRLAVQQAEAAYKVRSPHPMFIHWMQDPIAKSNSYLAAAHNRFVFAIFCSLAVQLFLVCILAALLSKYHVQ